MGWVVLVLFFVRNGLKRIHMCDVCDMCVCVCREREYDIVLGSKHLTLVL